MKKVIAVSLCAVVASFVLIQMTSAASLTADQRTRIAANCAAAQSTLQRIGSSDTTARINRGRDYDQILKLFYAMNTRAAANNITEPALAVLTKNFEDALNSFRANYNRYNDQLKVTSEANCKANVDGFYDSLAQTRAGRANINADIIKLDGIINDYQTAAGGLVK